jgi:hypothetical protein
MPDPSPFAVIVIAVVVFVGSFLISAIVGEWRRK